MSLLALAVIAAGCALFTPRFSIVGWSPNEARIADPGIVSLWLRFSARADRSSIEEAFSLTMDGDLVQGDFAWDGDVMRFVPAQRLERNHEYEIRLDTGAENENGVSLDEEFIHTFSTKTEDGRPALLSVTPADGAALTDRYARVEMSFSEAVDRDSLYGAFSLNPSVRGRFDWSAGDSTCAFVPLEPYAWQTEYRLAIQDGLADISGNTITKACATRFTIGTDNCPPEVLRLSNTVNNVEGDFVLAPSLPSDTVPVFSPLWESTWGLALVFSELVEREGLESHIRLEPAWSYAIDDRAALGSSFVLVPQERFSRDVLYSITINKGIKDAQGNPSVGESVCRFRVDGAATRSPALTRLRFRNNPGTSPAAWDDRLCDHGDDYSSMTVSSLVFTVGSPVETCVDLYFSLAPGASVNLFSLMREFSIRASNSCASFTLKKMQASGFSDPQPAEVAGSQCVRVILDLWNATDSGIVTFGLGEGFVDSAGNPIAGAWRLPLLK